MGRLGAVMVMGGLALWLGAQPAAAAGCPRPGVGGTVQPPADLYSRNGVLAVSLDYVTDSDAAGHTLLCFVTPEGLESPTLHVYPGDKLEITVTNRLPKPPPGSPTEVVSTAAERCGDVLMTIASVNLHLHGTNTAPTCHADQVIHTIINAGQTFHYSFAFPKDEPPGLYWYHPHVHGMSEAAVQAGASGAIVVEGIERLQPTVAGLPQRILLVRDQNLTNFPGGGAPSWDLSLNYVPVLYPDYQPAVLRMVQGASELWRVVNASADTIVELVLDYDGVAQPIQLAALDGVALGSQDGTRQGYLLTRRSIRLAPAARAEFIVTAPSAAVRSARLLTRRIDTGPLGDSDPARPLARIEAVAGADGIPVLPAVTAPPGPQRFEGLGAAPIAARHTLYFSERQVRPPEEGWDRPPWGGGGKFLFFITVAGQVPQPFDPLAGPAITARQGTVEEWTIENRSRENHEFHLHQIHFLVEARDGVPVPPDQRQMLDMIEVPYWSGSGPYPSVTLRLDFRGSDVGDFVYHCHILGHEDNGMMAIVRVLPASKAEGG